ncbi:hypothetical protein MVG78_19325 [Roseomonas gilardii subsp. gilardii]|uniref:DUF7336 domain-containing protein n=1 Tax=Roseomonas gilardii TaxID=257708 RepID=UPI001FF79823|nr:hypothetical protein [Roseomonas gilardii]UPG72593.1 hypothetical protein MVG78_19325 [Roseomonas gilardii subsp. gilardii]
MTEKSQNFWIVEHHEMDADGDETETDEIEMSMKLIGIYSSEEKARQAIGRMRQLPGFRDWPGGFRITEVVVDQELWPEGFNEADTGERPRP